jgi:hypothetical protein
MIALQWIAFAIGLILQVLLIRTLLRGSIRQYPILLLLIVTEFLSSVISAAANLDLRWTTQTARYFWISEIIQFALIYLCLVQILYQTLEGRSERSRLVYVVMGGVLFAGLSTVQAYDVRPQLWMTQLMRNLSFGSMLTAALVWSLSVRRPNRQRLLIVAGLGAQLAGTAVGHSLRQLSRSTVTAGNLILLGCYLLFLFTLLRAFAYPPVMAGSEGRHTQEGDSDDIDSSHHSSATLVIPDPQSIK